MGVCLSSQFQEAQIFVVMMGQWNVIPRADALTMKVKGGTSWGKG
jgi:hypothetical protein